METLIKYENVSYSYNENEVDRAFSLNTVNIDVDKNLFTLIYGKDGSGKSTLFKLLVGSLKLVHGDIKIDNVSTKGLSKTSISNLIKPFAIVSDDPIYPIIKDSKLRSYLEFLLANNHYKKEEIDDVIDTLCPIVGLSSLLNKTISYFKVIELRRIYLFQAIISRRKTLIINNIQELVNKKVGEDFMLYLRDNCKDKTVLFFSSSNTIIEDYVDRVFHIENGSVIEDIVYSDVPRLERDF